MLSKLEKIVIVIKQNSWMPPTILLLIFSESCSVRPDVGNELETKSW